LLPGFQLTGIHQIDPDVLPISVNYTLPVPAQHQPRISPDDWPQTRAEYPTKSLRQFATEWNVSPESIRKIVTTQCVLTRCRRGSPPWALRPAAFGHPL